jgi:RadC-like JAB domain
MGERAQDYPDFEAALQAASSRFGATHVVRQGNRSAIIYSPTSKGYERRSLSCDRGFFHWPKQADLVDEVPENAERVVDVLDLSFDPDAPPRRAPMPIRRAAEEARATIVDDPAHVPVGQVVWFKKAKAEKVSAFLDVIEKRGLTMVYAGPGDRYRVVQKGAEQMGAVREVMENRGREGRRYESAQWLEFECEPAMPTPELEEMAREFNHLVLEFLESYARTWSIDTSSLDADSFTWNAYASLVGHGVGLWEGDGDTGLRGEDEKKIDKALRTGWYAPGSARGKLHNLAHRISDECAMLQGPEGREAREEASIPTKAQLKIINAFREHRLMGNPMRDSISTDGDTIYSYRMPIARRTASGGIAIVDPAGAPSATTRNHIYGLQRTFTPAEISGTRAAEHDDDRGPETERMPAPAAPPRLQPGYAFYTPSKRKGDWKKIPNDDWEHVVIGEDEIEKSEFVGYRLIDGSMHDIFEIVFARGRGGRGYYAQLVTHTQGRSAAHEFAGGPATAWDFASPKEAIVHAQRTWGATHVDFHGTRNRPTVYGTKDGARWKKTLYKEKGKLHWPDKFSKGPKKLRGAIELTPVAAPTHAPAPVQHRAPPMQRPPTAPMPDRREGYVSEARRRGPQALPRRIDQTEIHTWSERDRAHVELRDKITGETIIEWWDDAVQDAIDDGFLDRRNLHASAFEYAVHVGLIKPQESWGPRRAARENPATDLQDAIPWVRVTRDPERYKEALARAQKIGPVDDAKKVYELVGPALMKEDQETFIVVLIDVRQNCRGVAEIHRGARSRVATSVLDVMRVVVASGAEGFIVCHNHPSGKAMPSDADRSLTKAIERAARPFKGETAFLDHVVCGSGEYFSFADNKLHRAKN